MTPTGLCPLGNVAGEGELRVCGALGHRCSRPDLLLWEVLAPHPAKHVAILTLIVGRQMRLVPPYLHRPVVLAA